MKPSQFVNSEQVVFRVREPQAIEHSPRDTFRNAQPAEALECRAVRAVMETGLPEAMSLEQRAQCAPRVHSVHSRKNVFILSAPQESRDCRVQSRRNQCAGNRRGRPFIRRDENDPTTRLNKRCQMDHDTIWLLNVLGDHTHRHQIKQPVGCVVLHHALRDFVGESVLLDRGGGINCGQKLAPPRQCGGQLFIEREDRLPAADIKPCCIGSYESIDDRLVPRIRVAVTEPIVQPNPPTKLATVAEAKAKALPDRIMGGNHAV
jgi:hypothetical protein